MIRLTLLTAVLLAGCAPQAVLTTPTVEFPSLSPEPALKAPVVIPPLEILDATQVTVTRNENTLLITLTSSGTWLRLRLPDGCINPVTTSPSCECVGLGGGGAHALAVSWLAGMSVETSDSLTGPWTPAARTH